LGISRLNLAKLFRDLAAQILVELKNLQLNLGDPAFRLRGRSGELTALAFEPCGLALELRQPGYGNEIFLPETADSLKLPANQFDFGGFGIRLPGQTAHFFL